MKDYLIWTCQNIVEDKLRYEAELIIDLQEAKNKIVQDELKGTNTGITSKVRSMEIRAQINGHRDYRKCHVKLTNQQIKEIKETPYSDLSQSLLKLMREKCEDLK